jgi:soluble lytic murein transglycosylase-like protein
VQQSLKAGVFFVLLAALPASAFAEGLKLSDGKRSRSSLMKSQMALLDGRLAKQYEGSTRLRPDADKISFATDGPMPRFTGSYKGDSLETARAAARKHNIPEDLFLRLVQRESGWNPNVTSSKGAQGLAQLMPGTADLLGVDINDPVQNLNGGARYLRMMYDKFGNWRLALAAYNAGPGAVEEHDGIPPFDETKAYVIAILG